jgi:hypothetical protein
MFQTTVGRSAIGLSLAVCMFWVSWTQGHQNLVNRSQSNLPGNAIVLPTGFLPTKPLSSARPLVVDLAENLIAYGRDSGASADFLTLFDFYTLSAPPDLDGASTAKSAANTDSGGSPKQSVITSDRSPVLVNQDLAQAASDLFSTQFDALFSSLFRISRSEARGLATIGEEDQNPFTKAKQDSDPAASKDATEQSQTNGSGEQQMRQTSLEAMQTSGNPDPRFLFLGDWDGSGILQSALATRINDTTFAFIDGRRTFSLYVNATAVEQQRSLAIEDANGDGIPDLLATSGGSLFGGVIAGDSDGNFTLTDTFVTGYEPVLAAVGPFSGAKREIITLNTRSGAVATFRFTDRFRMSKQQSLGFVPDYISHLVDQNQGTDHLLAAGLGQAARTYQILDDDTLMPSVDDLPSQPSLAISRDFLGKGGPQGLLQVFQTGPYASIVLSNATGDHFNVANLRIFSQIFIAIGDLNNDGTVDVGVARLK